MLRAFSNYPDDCLSGDDLAGALGGPDVKGSELLEAPTKHLTRHEIGCNFDRPA